VLVGAHYDSHADSPGANDNGSAVAALLELAQAFAGRQPLRTVRFAAFTNEEAPFTRTGDMGSYRYAAECRARGDAIVGMICLDTIGCRCGRAGSHRLSFGGLLMPRRSNFLAIANTGAAAAPTRRV
jgi:Zn-dependent M28 family amino/carboxypeptidase